MKKFIATVGAIATVASMFVQSNTMKEPLVHDIAKACENLTELFDDDEAEDSE